MGLSITISQRGATTCPECGAICGYKEYDAVNSGGRVWYDFLESVGYYVPYDQRSSENDWYGEDMKLTKEQVDELYQFVKNNEVFHESYIISLISIAKYEGHDVIINADW